MLTDRPIRTGTAYKAPKLYRFRASASRSRIEVLRPWPAPQAWVRIDDGRWLGARPRIDLGLPDRTALSQADNARGHRLRCEWKAAAQVPEAIRRVVSPFAPHGQWPLLSLVARTDGAEELVDQNPALAWGLAHSWLLRESPVQRPLRSARSLLTRPRREIARWLGFQGSRAEVRVLGRLPAWACSASSLHTLRTVLNQRCRWIYHLPKLNPASLQLLCTGQARDALSWELLEEVANCTQSEARRAQGLASLFRMTMERFDRLYPGRPRPLLRSVQRLQELAAETYEAIVEREVLRDDPFPRAPFPGQWVDSDTRVRLTPLVDPFQLFQHAEQQHNCLANDPRYRLQIQDGRGFAYALDWLDPRKGRPRCATLYLERQGMLHSRWAVRELQLGSNRPAGSWLKKAIDQFLVRTEPLELPPPRTDLGPLQLELPMKLPSPAGFHDSWDIPF